MVTGELTAQQALAVQGENVIEALGELFIAERFRIAHEPPDAEHAAVSLERFTRGSFPRFMLDPSKIPASLLTTARLKSDLKFLLDLVNRNESGFADLVTSLNNPSEFLRKAKKLGLTEANFVKAGGGWAWFVLALAPLLLGGCGEDEQSPPPECGEPHPGRKPGEPRSGTGPCTEPTGHGPHKGTADHRNKNGQRW